MLKQIVIKNPGCQFCRYYIPQFEYNGKLTTEACSKNAWKMFQTKTTAGKKRKWKWSDCDYAKEKNSDRLCNDFKIQSIIHSVFQKLTLVIRGAGEQHPPTFSGEIWWE